MLLTSSIKAVQLKRRTVTAVCATSNRGPNDLTSSSLNCSPPILYIVSYVDREGSRGKERSLLCVCLSELLQTRDKSTSPPHLNLKLIHTATPDTDRTVLSCVAGGENWALLCRQGRDQDFRLEGAATGSGVSTIRRPTPNLQVT